MKFIKTNISLVLCLIAFHLSGQSDSVKSEFSFDTDNPFHITITTSFKEFEQQFDTEKYFPAKVTYQLPNGNTEEKKIKLKSRGVYRKRHCEMPPLSANFSDKNYGIDLFNKIGSVKVVSYCNFSDEDEQALVKEYLCYKMYEKLTDYSFKTWFLKITYINSDNTDHTFTNYAFFIEDADKMAKRNNSVVIKTQKLSNDDLNSDSESIFTLYEFMIGNGDYYLEGQHNLKVVREANNINSPPIPIPYDFDFSGFVNASYSYPHKSLRLKNVRERIFLGNCRSKEEMEQIFNLFIEQKEAIYSLINDCKLLEKETKVDVTSFVAEFYDILSNKRLVKKNIYKKCW